MGNESCQACYLHKDHARCTGENTLGTRPCACRERGHKDVRPNTPVKRTNEPTIMRPNGDIVTYYVDANKVRWACTVDSHGVASWRLAPHEPGGTK